MLIFTINEFELMVEGLTNLLNFTKEVYKVADMKDNTKLNKIVELINKITDGYYK